MGFFRKLFGQEPPRSVEELPATEENTATVAPETEDADVQPTEPAPDNDAEAEHERIYRFETLRDDGLRAMQVGQLTYAVQCLEHALQWNDDEETRGHLAEALVRKGEGRQAIPLLEPLSKAHPDNAQLHTALAEAYEQAARWEEMEHEARQAMQLLPEDDNALYHLCRALHGKGDHAAAIEQLTLLMARNDRYTPLLQLRADSYAQTGQNELAMQDIAQLEAAGQATEETYLLQGRIHEVTGQEAAALQSYAAILQINPFSTEAPLALARIHLQAQRAEEARAALDDALEMQPDNAPVLRLRAQVLRQLGLEEAAQADEDAATQLQSTNPDAPESLEDDINKHLKTLNPFGF